MYLSPRRGFASLGLRWLIRSVGAAERPTLRIPSKNFSSNGPLNEARALVLTHNSALGTERSPASRAQLIYKRHGFPRLAKPRLGLSWNRCSAARRVVCSTRLFGQPGNPESILPWMALNTLKQGNVTEVHWVLKGLVRLVTRFALAIGESAQVNGMLKRPTACIFLRRAGRIVKHRMTDVAVIPDYLAGIAHVLAVVTAKTSGEIEMANIVWMGPPVDLHFRKSVSAEDSLQFSNRVHYQVSLVRVDIRIINAIEISQASADRV